jgi:hypothetical protein
MKTFDWEAVVVFGCLSCEIWHIDIISCRKLFRSWHYTDRLEYVNFNLGTYHERLLGGQKKKGMATSNHLASRWS